MLSNILNIYCKNIFNNFLIAESYRTRTHLFQKLLSPAPAPESRNAPVLHRTSSLRNTDRPQNLIGSSLVSLSHILTCILWSSERQNRLLFLRSFFVRYMQTTYLHDLLTLIQIVTCKLEENQYWYR